MAAVRVFVSREKAASCEEDTGFSESAGVCGVSKLPTQRSKHKRSGLALYHILGMDVMRLLTWDHFLSDAT